jgi:hypothetical protein
MATRTWKGHVARTSMSTQLLFAKVGAVVVGATVVAWGLAACRSGNEGRVASPVPGARDGHASPAAGPGRKGEPPGAPSGQSPRSAETGRDAGPGPSASLDGHQAAFEAARPAFARHCFRCHTAAGEAGRKSKAKAIRHVDMGSYPFGGHHPHDVARLVRTSLLGDEARGKKPTMPADDVGSVTGPDLEAILAWASAFERAGVPATPGRARSKRAPAGHQH